MSKIGLIGLGYWGKNHLRAIKKLQEEDYIDKIVVCDINEHSLLEAKRNNNIEIQRDWTKLLEDETLDMVSIVTPSPLHYGMAKEFLLCGKDVLVEKPMAMNSFLCNDLISISEEMNSGLMVGHIFRFHSGVLELKKRIEKGEFGEILYINVRRQALVRPRKDMGVMMALGIHEVDLTCFLLGDKRPDSIFADLNYYFGKNEEMAFIIQKFGNTTAYSFESWLDPSKGKLREMNIIGSQGSASLNFLIPDRIVLHQSYLQENIVYGGDFNISIKFKEPLLEEIKHFVTESQQKKNYKSNGYIGKRAVEMIERAYESYDKGRFVLL